MIASVAGGIRTPRPLVWPMVEVAPGSEGWEKEMLDFVDASEVTRCTAGW